MKEILIDLIDSIDGGHSQSNQIRGEKDKNGNPIEERLYMAFAYDRKYGTAQHLVYVLKRLRPGVRGFAIDAGSAYGAITKEEITSPIEMVYREADNVNWKDAFGKRFDMPVNVEQFVRLAKFAGYEAELVVNRYGGGAGSGETVYAIGATTHSMNKLSDGQRKTNAEYIYNYLKNEGWTTQAICGLFGNIHRESWFNPGVWQNITNGHGNTKYGYGLAQWTAAEDKILIWLSAPSGSDPAVGFGERKANKVAMTCEDSDKMANENAKQLMDHQLK